MKSSLEVTGTATTQNINFFTPGLNVFLSMISSPTLGIILRNEKELLD
jgi:hypothetical protein